jgi:hypothetical protein
MSKKHFVRTSFTTSSSRSGSGMAPAPTARRPYPKRTSRRWSPRLAAAHFGARTALQVEIAAVSNFGKGGRGHGKVLDERDGEDAGSRADAADSEPRAQRDAGNITARVHAHHRSTHRHQVSGGLAIRRARQVGLSEPTEFGPRCQCRRAECRRADAAPALLWRAGVSRTLTPCFPVCDSCYAHGSRSVIVIVLVNVLSEYSSLAAAIATGPGTHKNTQTQATHTHKNPHIKIPPRAQTRRRSARAYLSLRRPPPP